MIDVASWYSLTMLLLTKSTATERFSRSVLNARFYLATNAARCWLSPVTARSAPEASAEASPGTANLEVRVSFGTAGVSMAG